MAHTVGGRKRFKGIIAGIEDDMRRVELTDARAGSEPEVMLPLAGIDDAHLILTEALVRETLREEKRKAKQNHHAAADGEGRMENDDGS